MKSAPGPRSEHSSQAQADCGLEWHTKTVQSGLLSATLVGLAGLSCLFAGQPRAEQPAHTPVQTGAPRGHDKSDASTASRAAAEAVKLNAAAVSELSARRYGEAIELLNRARRLLPEDKGIAFNLGLACVNAGRFAEAIEPLNIAAAEPGRMAAVHFLLGTANFETGRFLSAAEHLEAVRSNPEYGENALYLLEESYRKSGDARAQQAFLDLVKLKPDSALVHKLLGTAYDAQGRFPEALAEFKQASESDAGLPEVRFDAGLLSLKMHDAEAARHWLQAELDLNPCYAAAHYYLGDIERKASHWAPATESFRKAIACAPDYADAHLALGVALQAQNLGAAAIPVLRRAVELAPGKSEAHFQLARALAKAGRAEESRVEWQKAQALAAAQDTK